MRELVQAASGGDREAFDSLVSVTIDHLFAIAVRITRDIPTAEDAVQVALLAAWRDLPRLRDVDKFDPWLRQLLVRACYDEVRRARARRGRLQVATVQLTSPDHATGIADRDELDRAFERLTSEQRATVVLHHYVGLPLTEVAATLGIPEGTARSRLHYAIQGLRAAVEADQRTGTTKERLA
jgi:RNA polymerase sigma-70 factor (ECF subfamily)